MASPLLRRCIRTAAGALLVVTAAPALGAQTATRPYLDWRTVETAHFRIHYPAGYGRWARDVAAHVEGVDSAVSRLVGFTPQRPVNVVVSNPYDEPNGSALPFLDAPVLNFWPVPPDPREDIGNWRSWGEMLSVHEFAHLAHLTRPSRNPLDRLFWRLMPVDLGPLPQKLPRWAIEGYATYVEGQVTGSGRPNGAWRAAVLRQWAIEGHLPSYAEMSGWGAFNGGDFAYLAGSAFMEWLATRYGDSTLVFVWRRASARVERTFDDAFTGVYGDPPPVLYGRFTAQLTAQAMAAVRAIDTAGRTQGALQARAGRELAAGIAELVPPPVVAPAIAPAIEADAAAALGSTIVDGGEPPSAPSRRGRIRTRGQTHGEDDSDFIGINPYMR